MLAVLAGQLDIVNELLRHMADLAKSESEYDAGRAAHVIHLAMEPCPETGMTPLHLAAALGQKVVILRLLDVVMGKHVRIKHTGTESDDLLAAQAKLKRATIEALNAQTHGPSDVAHGCTALFFAAQHDNRFCVRHLCACARIDLNRPNSFGATPLLVAVQRKHQKVVVTLLNAGAEPNKRTQTSPRGAGITPLHLAVYNGDLKRTQALLTCGASLRVMGNMQCGGRLRTERMLAVFFGEFQLAKALHNAGKRVEPKLNSFSQDWITILRENTGVQKLSAALKIDQVELRRRYVWKNLSELGLAQGPDSDAGDAESSYDDDDGDNRSDVGSEASGIPVSPPVSPAAADSALESLAESLFASHSTITQDRGFMSMRQLCRVLLRLRFAGRGSFGSSDTPAAERRLCFEDFLSLVFHRLADNERVLRQGVFGETVIPKQKFIKYFPRLIRLRQLMDDWSDQQQRVLEQESTTKQIAEKAEEDVDDSTKSTGSATSIDEKEEEDVDE